MTAGSPQTIDRIQVEFSTNIEEMVRDLSTVEGRLDEVNSAFSRSESASKTYVSTLTGIGNAVSTSTEGFTALSSGIDQLSSTTSAGASAMTAYSGSFLQTQNALTSVNPLMTETSTRMQDLGLKATTTSVAVNGVTSASNTVYSTLIKLNSGYSTSSTAIAKLASTTSKLPPEYQKATSTGDAFTISLEKLGSTVDTVTTQINKYTTSINTATMNSKGATGSLDDLSGKADDTGSKMGTLGTIAKTVFAGFSVAGVIAALDEIITKSMEVYQTLEGIETAVEVSLGLTDTERNEKGTNIATNLQTRAPSSTVESLPSAASTLVRAYGDQFSDTVLEELTLQFAGFADITKQSLSGVAPKLTKIFDKYGITTYDQMVEALTKIYTVSSETGIGADRILTLLNDKRAQIGDLDWDFNEVMSRVYNAGYNDISKLEDYLTAIDSVKKTHPDMFKNQAELTAWLNGLNELGGSTTDKVEIANILNEKYGIDKAAGQYLAKYLTLSGQGNNSTGTIDNLSQKNKSPIYVYSSTTGRTNEEITAHLDKSYTNAQEKVGEAMTNAQNKIYQDVIYTREMYDVIDLPMDDISQMIAKVPVLGTFAEMYNKWVPATEIKSASKWTPKEFIEQYESISESGGYVPFDENYYLAYRKYATQLGIDYSDLKFTGVGTTEVENDVTSGIYLRLMNRVKSFLESGEIKDYASDASEVIGEKLSLGYPNGVNLSISAYDLWKSKPTGETGSDFTWPRTFKTAWSISEQSRDTLFPYSVDEEGENAGGFMGALRSFFDTIWPVARVSAADEVTFNPDWLPEEYANKYGWSVNATDTGSVNMDLGNLDGADKDIEDLGKATEGALPQIQNFTTEGTVPLENSIGGIAGNISDTMYQDQLYQAMLPTQMEALGNETTAVNDLAAGYERLAAAKKAAAEA